MENPSKTAECRKICDALHACSEMMKRYAAHKDKRRLSGLTINQIEILHYVARTRSGSAMFGDLTREFGLSKSLASQSVTRLVKQGYLRKTRSGKDGRNIILSRTNKLEKLYNKIKEIEKRHFFPAIEKIPGKKRENLRDALELLHRKLNDELI